MSETVGSSPEAIAACVARLKEQANARGLAGVVEHDAAALLAQVARERDEARALREQMRVDRFHECESVRAEAKAAIATAERQLAEARALAMDIEDSYLNDDNSCGLCGSAYPLVAEHGPQDNDAHDKTCPVIKARALLSGGEVT